MDAYRVGATGNTVLEKTREMKKSHRVPLMIDQQPRVSYDRSRGRRIVMDLERDERGAEGGVGGDEVVFDQESFASKLRHHLFQSGNPRFRLAKLGSDLRVHGREAPSTDLAGWVEGTLVHCTVDIPRRRVLPPTCCVMPVPSHPLPPHGGSRLQCITFR